MNKFLLPLVGLSLLVSGCAGLNSGSLGGVATPQRCEDAIARVTTLEALVKLLPSLGVPQHDADGISQALAQGQVSIQAVCDFARSQETPPNPTTSST